jgi:alkylation response protein AidB-like acyl-CoA dehydrogenase
MDSDRLRFHPDGAPVLRSMVFPISDVEIIDTWTSTGLRGSGCHDYAVHDVFVPTERSFWLPTETPFQSGPLFAFRGIYISAATAIAVGIGRAATDALVDLAAAKMPTRSTRLLRERAMVQAQVARAEVLVSSARAFAWQATADVWEAVLAGREVTVRQRALFRLAISNAVSSAVQAVDLMYAMGGGSSVFAANRSIASSATCTHWRNTQRWGRCRSSRPIGCCSSWSPMHRSFSGSRQSQCEQLWTAALSDPVPRPRLPSRLLRLRPRRLRLRQRPRRGSLFARRTSTSSLAACPSPTFFQSRAVSDTWSCC